jgi:hypothetical protein
VRLWLRPCHVAAHRRADIHQGYGGAVRCPAARRDCPTCLCLWATLCVSVSLCLCVSVSLCLCVCVSACVLSVCLSASAIARQARPCTCRRSW